MIAHAGTGADAAATILVLGGLLALVMGLRRSGRARHLAFGAAAMCALAAVTANLWAPKVGSASAARPSTAARLAIAAPAPGAVEGPSFDVRLQLTGGRLSPSAGAGRLVRDEGHIHLSLDGRLVAMTPGLVSSLSQVPSGDHTLTAEFVANDHAPFSPRVPARRWYGRTANDSGVTHVHGSPGPRSD